MNHTNHTTTLTTVPTAASSGLSMNIIIDIAIGAGIIIAAVIVFIVYKVQTRKRRFVVNTVDYYM